MARDPVRHKRLPLRLALQYDADLALAQSLAAEDEAAMAATKAAAAAHFATHGAPQGLADDADDDGGGGEGEEDEEGSSHRYGRHMPASIAEVETDGSSDGELERLTSALGISGGESLSTVSFPALPQRRPLPAVCSP